MLFRSVVARSADSLSGGAGNDRLYGGTGHDSLTGGAGQNGFYFHTPLDARNNVDAIADFSPAYDTLFLEGPAFAAIGRTGALIADAFVTGSAARDAEDRIVYDKAAGRLSFDADGTGPAAAILFATLTPGTALTHADFHFLG